MSILMARIASEPAALLVAIGVLGALGLRARRRLSSATLPERRGMPQTLPFMVPDVAGATFAAEDDCSVHLEEDDSSGALRLLDAWSGRPWSAWQELGRRCLRASPTEAGEVATSSLILEGVAAHHANAFEAWCIRDGAHTAWQLARCDTAPLPETVEDTARQAVLNAALATLTRASLPSEDYERLLARVG